MQGGLAYTKIRECECFHTETYMACLNYAHGLSAHKADICAKDKLDRCPVVSAIAGGQLRSALAIVCAFAQTPANQRRVRHFSGT